jgi:hypothetical protein
MNDLHERLSRPFRLNDWTVVPDRNELISPSGRRTLEPKARPLVADEVAPSRRVADEVAAKIGSCCGKLEGRALSPPAVADGDVCAGPVCRAESPASRLKSAG